jgi:hypothetical protein
MPVSDRKIRANVMNSQKSTGPKTDAGKEHSRANALKHGLSGAGVVVSDAEAVARRCEEWRLGFQVDSAQKEWALEQVAVNSIRINECQDEVRSIRKYEARRAAIVWEVDKEADAALLGDKLARNPEVVSKQLMQSKYGCRWLLEQWTYLGSVLEAGDSWNDDQIQRVMDLTGTPRHCRADVAPVNDPAWLVNNKFRQLEELLADRLESLDKMERLAAESGSPVEPSKKIALLRRYEAACVKRMNAALRMLHATTIETLEVSAQPPEPAPESPPPDPDPLADELAYQKAYTKAFADYDKAWEAAPESERAALVPNLPPAPLPSIRLRDALPTPATKLAGMNRRQRKAMAKRTAQGK